MKISIIIVSWNAKAFLLKCVDSVLAQETTCEREVIVVDNASTDGSADAVSAAYPSVRVIRNDRNYGFARATNTGIFASSGEFLYLINSDVEVSAGCFQAMLEHVSQHPEVAIAGPRIVGPAGQVQRSCMSYPSLSNTFWRALALDAAFPSSRLFGGQLLTFWQHDDTRTVDVVNGCFWMVRRSAVQQVGLLDERFRIYGEDVDWCKRFTEHGWKVLFFAGAHAVHYGGASSANAPVKFHLEMQRANYQYWLKHHSRLRANVFLMINLLHQIVRGCGTPLRYLSGRLAPTAAALALSKCHASIAWTLRTFLDPASVRTLQSRGEAL